MKRFKLALLGGLLMAWLNAIQAANLQRTITTALDTIERHHAYLDSYPVDISCLRKAYQINQELTPGAGLKQLESLMLEFTDNHMHLNANNNDSYRLKGPVVVTEKAGRFIVCDYWHNQLLQRQGLQVGAELLSINGQSPRQIIDQFPTRCLDKTKPRNQQWVINKALAGIYAQPRLLELQAEAKRFTVDLDALSYREREGLLSQQIIDQMAVITIHNSLGQADLIEAFDQALASVQHTRGLVLDLRNTIGGGDSYIARAIMSRLIKQAQPYQKHRFLEQRGDAAPIPRSWFEYVEPRLSSYDSPVVVLVNHWTGSMGEGLAIGLQGMNRATLMGTPMAGLLGAVNGFPLSGLSYGFQMPIEQLYRIDGTPRERVLPDIIVTPGNDDSDQVLARAIDHLKTLTKD